MAKAYTGRDGRLLIAGIEQIKVTSWQLTGAVEMLETTSLGDAQRSYAPGVQEFNGSATILYYNDGTGRTGRNDAATALRKVLKVSNATESDAVTIRLRLAEGSINHDVALTAYITNVTYGASVGEISSAQISFQATGALSEVTL